MSEFDDEAKIDDLIKDYGLTSYNRRLADKILNAFNQAMSVGRTDVAEALQTALRVCVDEEQEMRNAAFMEKAESWRRFVATRDTYKTACMNHPEDSKEAQDALLEMRAAYNDWSRL